MRCAVPRPSRAAGAGLDEGRRSLYGVPYGWDAGCDIDRLSAVDAGWKPALRGSCYRSKRAATPMPPLTQSVAIP